MAASARRLTSGQQRLVGMIDGVIDTDNAAQGERLQGGRLHGVQVGDGQISHPAHHPDALVLAGKRSAS